MHIPADIRVTATHLRHPSLDSSRRCAPSCNFNPAASAHIISRIAVLPESSPLPVRQATHPWRQAYAGHKMDWEYRLLHSDLYFDPFHHQS
ncbi:hypothetical protein M378DRAFT_794244 [Amanita muscaria Koide BX008]|uniref:Uncharacterized protein n=1 Tax=Amanita muscaria (strain Koide BX008) TaxID=946122 RepID=A0A0C2SH34_AMAMK|nr:hypothetical protein M378DRAFT_794244 [Amanita muscaria Koide BX008]